MPSLPYVVWSGLLRDRYIRAESKAQESPAQSNGVAQLKQAVDRGTDSCTQDLEGPLTRKGQPCGKGGETLLGGRAEAKPLHCFYCGEGLPGSK